MWFLSCKSLPKDLQRFMDDIASIKKTNSLYDNDNDELIVQELYNLLIFNYPHAFESPCLLNIEIGGTD